MGGGTLLGTFLGLINFDLVDTNRVFGTGLGIWYKSVINNR